MKPAATPTEAQKRIVEETRRIAKDQGPFVALTITASYREAGNPDPHFIRTAHATAFDDEDLESAALAIVSLPAALRHIANELEEKVRSMSATAHPPRSEP